MLTLLLALLGTFVIPLGAQPPAKPDASPTDGAVLFRQECVFCHGVGARGGVRGPDLTTGTWIHGGADADLARTIKEGIPGTAMPPHRLTDDEIAQIIAYLRTIQQPVTPQAGDPRHGEMLFFANDRCSSCHMVRGRGGRLGPELTTIGSARPRAYLIESIRDPNRQIVENRLVPGPATVNYDTVTAVTSDGATIVGVTMNEDTFSVQIMDRNERVHSFDKKSLRSFRHENRSLMPAYGPNVLSDSDLQDLLAYLQSLRASTPPAEKGSTNGRE